MLFQKIYKHLKELLDVLITTPTQGQALTYDATSGKWINSTIATGGDTSGKADKVSGATSGNFAGLNSSGNLTDSGHKSSDYVASGSLGSLAALSSVDNAHVSAGIDAAKIGNGSVSNAEFQTLDGVTSAIQTQLNGKLSVSGGTVGGSLNLAGFDLDGVSTIRPVDNIVYFACDVDVNGFSLFGVRSIHGNGDVVDFPDGLSNNGIGVLTADDLLNGLDANFSSLTMSGDIDMGGNNILANEVNAATFIFNQDTDFSGVNVTGVNSLTTSGGIIIGDSGGTSIANVNDLSVITLTSNGSGDIYFNNDANLGGNGLTNCARVDSNFGVEFPNGATQNGDWYITAAYLADYLPLSGGAMTGDLNINGHSITNGGDFVSFPDGITAGNGADFGGEVQMNGNTLDLGDGQITNCGGISNEEPISISVGGGTFDAGGGTIDHVSAIYDPYGTQVFDFSAGGGVIANLASTTQMNGTLLMQGQTIDVGGGNIINSDSIAINYLNPSTGSSITSYADLAMNGYNVDMGGGEIDNALTISGPSGTTLLDLASAILSFNDVRVASWNETIVTLGNAFLSTTVNLDMGGGEIDNAYAVYTSNLGSPFTEIHLLSDINGVGVDIHHFGSSYCLGLSMQGNNIDMGGGVINAHSITDGNSNPLLVEDTLGGLTLANAFVVNSSGYIGLPTASPSGSSWADATTLANGQVWYDGTNLKVRLGGVTKTVNVS